MPYHSSKGVRIVKVVVKKEPRKKQGWFFMNAWRAGRDEQRSTSKLDTDPKVRKRMFEAIKAWLTDFQLYSDDSKSTLT